MHVNVFVYGGKSEVVIGGTFDETFDVHVISLFAVENVKLSLVGHLTNFRCACQVPLVPLVVSECCHWGGEIGSPHPSPLPITSIAMRTPEEEGLHFSPPPHIAGVHFAMPQRALAMSFGSCPSKTCRKRHVMLRQERHAHKDHHVSRVKVSECETSKQECLLLALLASVWTWTARMSLPRCSNPGKSGG